VSPDVQNMHVGERGLLFVGKKPLVQEPEDLFSPGEEEIAPIRDVPERHGGCRVSASSVPFWNGVLFPYVSRRLSVA
jgi:hypothetical protein